MTNNLKLAGAASVAAALAAVLSVPASAQVDVVAGNASLTKGEAKLAKLLDGRVAGTPQSCIPSQRVRDFEAIDGTALVYEVGNVVYVNYTEIPDSIDDNDGIKTRQFGSRLCRLDSVTTFSRNSGLYTGNLFLTDFVPYRRLD